MNCMSKNMSADKPINILWSSRSFGGAEIYARRLDTQWKTSTITLDNIKYMHFIRLLCLILFSQKSFIFHDIRASLLCILRPTRKNIIVIHGPGRYPLVTKIFVSLFCVIANKIVVVSRDIVGSLRLSNVTILPNYSSIGMEVDLSSVDAIYFGRVTKAKSIDKLLDFWTTFSVKGTLHLVGDGPYLETATKYYDKNPRIKFYGSLPQESIKNIASKCLMYISFSTKEGTSLSLVESLDGGLLPIVTKIPSQEFIASTFNLPMIEGSYSKLANDIKSIQGMTPNAKKDLSDALKKYVLLRHSKPWLDFWSNALN